jgi:hypothetical protein
MLEATIQSFNSTLEEAKAKGLLTLLTPFEGMEGVLRLVTCIQSSGVNKNTLRCVQKMQPFLSCLQQYDKAMQIYVNVSPLILAPLWGSIHIVLQASQCAYAVDFFYNF